MFSRINKYIYSKIKLITIDRFERKFINHNKFIFNKKKTKIIKF